MTPKTKTTYSHPGANCPSISVILSADAPVQFELNAWGKHTAEELDAFMELCQEVRRRHAGNPPWTETTD